MEGDFAEGEIVLRTALKQCGLHVHYTQSLVAGPDRRISRSLAHDHSETKPLFRTRLDIRHATGSRSTSRDPGRTVSPYLQESDSNRISFDVHGRLGTRGCGSFLDKVVDRARANGTPLISIPSQALLALRFLCSIKWSAWSQYRINSNSECSKERQPKRSE